MCFIVVLFFILNDPHRMSAYPLFCVIKYRLFNEGLELGSNVKSFNVVRLSQLIQVYFRKWVCKKGGRLDQTRMSLQKCSISVVNKCIYVAKNSISNPKRKLIFHRFFYSLNMIDYILYLTVSGLPHYYENNIFTAKRFYCAEESSMSYIVCTVNMI